MTDDASTEAAGDAAGGSKLPARAIVIFHDDGAGFWPWLFGRPGFRHCFVALNDGQAWVVIDPCSDGMRIDADISVACDLAGHYQDLGYAVMETAVSPIRRPYAAPWAFTCVEAVKRILGVHGWTMWTPYQLYRHLEKDHGSNR